MADFIGIPWELVQRYDRPLPRYTSYPTVPHWRTVEDGEVEDGLGRVAALEERIAVYVHVPFCHRMCYYCGCNTTVTKRQEVIDRYVDSLCTEIDRVGSVVGEKALAQLHFGGGTPSLLPVDVLQRIIDHIYAAFPPEARAEISMELDPTITTPEHYPALKSFGFNRVSLGVQDFDDDVQVVIGRDQWSSISYQAFDLAREAGFESINLDLLYGLPLQTPGHLERSARAVAELGAERVAIFGYAHVPWMKPHQKKMERFPLPQGPERWEMFQAARKVFYDAGYEPVGFDHFAKPEDDLAKNMGHLNRNFQGYTVLEPMSVLAFGSTAIADLNDRFVQNEKRLTPYMSAIDAGGLAPELVCIRSEEDEARRALIIDLMCNMGLHRDRLDGLARDIFDDTLREKAEHFAPLAEGGLLELSETDLEVSERGRAFLRVVASAFDGYLGQQSTARFSQAV